VPDNAQNPSVLPGKLLRYNSDGTIPGDNPIPGNPMFALGLRNPFGLAFHPVSGTPYLSDNGPTCDDEINRIVANGNYGWRPNYPCGDTDPQYRQPLVRFGMRIAPTGVSFYSGAEFPNLQGFLLLASLNDGTVRWFQVDDSDPGQILSSGTLATGFSGGALDAVPGPDGMIYVASAGAIYRLSLP
jgi:glucose/arabinose dehydrogenase